MKFSYAIITLSALSLLNFEVKSQSEFSTGINTVTPNNNAVLHIVAPNNDQGILIPVMSSTQRQSMSLSNTDNGLMVYDSEEGSFYYWQDEWKIVINGDDIAQLLSEETDPSVPENIKDGIDWSELTGIPDDFADGTDDGGITAVTTDGSTITGDGASTPLSVGTISSGSISGLSTVSTSGSFLDLVDVPNGISDGDDIGLTTVAADGSTISGDGVNTALSIVSVPSSQVTGLTALATSADWNDLVNIPTDIADGDDSGLVSINVDGTTITGDGDATNLSVGSIASSQVSGLATLATSGDWTDIANIPADIADGDDTGGITSVNVDGSTITGDGNATNLSVGTIGSGQVSGLATIATTADWNDLVNIPADIADGDDDLGLLFVNVDGTTITGDGDLTDLSVGTIGSGQVSGLASIATTADWNDLANIPADIADGDDGGGLSVVNVDGTSITGDGDATALSIGVVPVLQVSGLSSISTTGDWADLINIPSDIDDGDDIGLVTVNVDGTTIIGDGDASNLSVNAINGSHITDGSINEFDLANSITGDGLHGAGGSVLAVDLLAGGGLGFNSGQLEVSDVITANTYSVTVGDVISYNDRGQITAITVSDRMLKKEIVEFKDVLNKVLSTKAYSYYWKDPEQKQKQIGFIAQELENQFPELVLENAKGTKHVNYSGMIPILVESIKEQQEIINTLKEELAASSKQTQSILSRLEALENRTDITDQSDQ